MCISFKWVQKDYFLNLQDFSMRLQVVVDLSLKVVSLKTCRIVVTPSFDCLEKFKKFEANLLRINQGIY